MTTSLLVDIGNTRIKWALQTGRALSGHGSCSWRSEGFEHSFEAQWSRLPEPNVVRVCSVVSDQVNSWIEQWCQSNWQLKPDFVRVTESYAGLNCCYTEPRKLGVDRWFAMLGAWYPRKKEVCIIDAGSAVTIDRVNARGEHLGGLIAPGLRLLGKALTEHTHALEHTDTTDFPLLADNTEDAINSGCYHWLLGGIEFVITQMQRERVAETCQSIEYIVTGGDAELLQGAVSVQLEHIPDLVLQGLMIEQG